MSGIFKELYRNHGIYWHGRDGYGDETRGYGDTLSDAKHAIDNIIANIEKREADEKAAKIANGNCLVCRRTGDRVTVETPDGTLSMSIREFRNRVFDLEDQYDKDTVFAD